MPDIYQIPPPKDRLPVFFVTVYLAQGLVGVAYEPISYLLKDGLGLGAAESAKFVAWMTLPILLKPVLGLLTDALPLGGRRRVPWLMAAAASAALAWGALAALPSYAYLPTLLLLAAANAGIVFSDVVCDGVMVERGKHDGKTGVYQAFSIGTLYACALLTGLGGGLLVKHASYRTIFALTALCPLLILGAAALVPDAAAAPGAPRRAASGLWATVRSPAVWTVAGLIFLINFSPFQGTAFFYYQTESLRFSPVLIGLLTSIDGVAGLAGAAVFGGWCRGFAPRTLARAAVWASAPLTLLWLSYGPSSAPALTAVFGFFGVASRLALMDLAARSCPKDGEATAFALFMSVFNLAAWASNALGAAAYGSLAPSGAGRAMAMLIAASAASSLLALPLLRVLPSSAKLEAP
ncbi:MAG: hypothetical protein HYZ75_14300 [Elusimicrobia bacterium]|nr:hypothetical protein [Elusimicrobiota bacterium]